VEGRNERVTQSGMPNISILFVALKPQRNAIAIANDFEGKRRAGFWMLMPNSIQHRL
jgi:hypothetical protein